MKIKSTFGNYKYEISAEPTPAQLASLAVAGLLQIAQRSPASAAEKEMEGYDKRPEGFKRDSIKFSESGAEILAKHLGTLKWKDDDGTEHSVKGAVVVSEHVPGIGAEPKYKREREKLAVWESKPEWETLVAEKLAFTGETHGADGEYAPALCEAMKKFLDKIIADGLKAAGLA